MPSVDGLAAQVARAIGPSAVWAPKASKIKTRQQKMPKVEALSGWLAATCACQSVRTRAFISCYALLQGHNILVNVKPFCATVAARLVARSATRDYGRAKKFRRKGKTF